MTSYHRLPSFLVPLLVLFVAVRGAAAQPDAALANAQHDPQRWLHALLQVEGDDRVRVEVSRVLLDPGNRRDFHVRERIVLNEPVFFPDSIDYDRARIANEDLRAAVEGADQPLMTMAPRLRRRDRR